VARSGFSERRPFFHKQSEFRACFYLQNASDIDSLFRNVVGNTKAKRRSGCPVSISLEIFGDRWSLLVIRDLMVRGLRTFKEFEESGEGIATNILSDRLEKLERAGIIIAEKEKSDRRRANYRLTQKGIDLAPVLLELLIWGARHEDTGAPCAVIEQMENNREKVLAEARRRWRERDSTPLIPRFDQVVKKRARAGK
jgi:DNA-binding HxlR family transcriptional regulator